MSDFGWKNLDALWLLWLLPAVAVLAALAHVGTRRAADSFAGPVMRRRLMPDLGAAGPLLRGVLFGLGLGLVVVALAQPSWNFDYVTRSARGVDVVVALDLSRSMLADDGGETRLERARSAISDLVEDLPGDRLGLVGFAGEQTVFCPLTHDRGFFLQSLRNASPDTVGRGGTLIGPALERALAVLEKEHGRDKVILLVTDAGDQDSFPKTAAQALAKQRVRVVALGIGRTGSNEKAPLVLDGQVVRDADGNPVSARVDEDLLREIATATQGLYIPPGQSHRLRELYRKYVDPLEKGESKEMQEKQRREQYQWFLLPGILLLVLQAGMAPYRSRPGLAHRRVALPLLLVALALGLPACGDAGDAERVEKATLTLRQGDAAAAATALEDVLEDRPEDPVVLYDLACAHQGTGNVEKTRQLLGQVMALGDRTLRARAQVNLALLDVTALQEIAGDDVEAAGDVVRADVRRLAETALDRLQRARDLDPQLEEASRRQDVVARWLRVTEDRWASRDREAARVKRHGLKGGAFLQGLLTFQREILDGIAGAKPMHQLALDQQDVIADLDLIPEKVKDEAPKVAEEAQAAINEEVEQEVRGRCKQALEDLQNGRLQPAARSTAASARALVGVGALWLELGDAIALLARVQADAAGLLEAILQAPDRGASAWSLVKEHQSQLIPAIERVERRVDGAGPDTLHPVWLSLAKPDMVRVLEAAREVLAEIPDDPEGSLAEARRATRLLQRLAEDWRLSKLAAVPLARALETASRDLSFAIASADPLALASDAESPGARFEDQLRRLGYLDQALQSRVMENAPEEATEAEAKALETTLASLVERKTAAELATSAGAKAWEEGGWPPPATVKEHLDLARRHLRDLWLELSTFEETLAAAAEEQARAAQVSAEAARVAGDDDTLFPAPLNQPPLDVATQAGEQGLATALISRLSARLPGEQKINEAKAPDVGQTEAASPEAEEARQVAEALASIEDLLRQAHASALQAEGALQPSEVPTQASTFKALMGRVHPPQSAAAALLAEAQAALQRARLGLDAVAARIMNGTLNALPLSRDLAAAGPGVAVQVRGEDLLAKDLAEGLDQVLTTFVDRLDGALRRTLAQMRPKGEEGAEIPEEQKRAFEETTAALEAMVAQTRDAYGQALERLRADEPTPGAEALATTFQASRRIWRGLADLKGMLEQAIREQRQLGAQTTEAREGAAAASSVRRDHLVAAQGFTRELIPDLERLVETGSQSDAQGGGGGVPEEVVELANKNLPLAEEAMTGAEADLAASLWSAALEKEQRAQRLLEEILEKLEEQDEDDQDQSQNQPQPQQGASDDERRRQERVVEDRSRALQKKDDDRHQKRSPVKEDW
jgi:hypothetical protein